MVKDIVLNTPVDRIAAYYIQYIAEEIIKLFIIGISTMIGIMHNAHANTYNAHAHQQPHSVEKQKAGRGQSGRDKNDRNEIKREHRCRFDIHFTVAKF